MDSVRLAGHCTGWKFQCFWGLCAVRLMDTDRATNVIFIVVQRKCWWLKIDYFASGVPRALADLHAPRTLLFSLRVSSSLAPLFMAQLIYSSVFNEFIDFRACRNRLLSDLRLSLLLFRFVRRKNCIFVLDKWHRSDRATTQAQLSLGWW